MKMLVYSLKSLCNITTTLFLVIVYNISKKSEMVSNSNYVL
nr:MAG TPA: hypothetical protein [Caudoviricetes sp.]